MGPTGPSRFSFSICQYAFNERKDSLDPEQNNFFFKKGPERHFQNLFNFRSKIHIVVGLKLMKTCVN